VGLSFDLWAKAVMTFLRHIRLLFILMVSFWLFFVVEEIKLILSEPAKSTNCILEAMRRSVFPSCLRNSTWIVKTE